MNLKKNLRAIARKSNFLFSAVQSLRRMYYALYPVRGKGNRIIFEGGGIFHRVKKDIAGNGNTVFVESGVQISNTLFYIRGNNHTIRLGKGSSFAGGSFWLEGENGRIVIGAGTSVVSAHLCVQEHDTEVVIGEDCMLSNNITIRTSDSHPMFDRENRRLNPAASVHIGNHVWICAKATVMKGVSVGDGAVIGYQSVITKNVPPHALAVGVPARVVRSEVHWTRDALF